MKQYPLVIAGAAVWAVAWFMPVIVGEPTLLDGRIPGWQAFRQSLNPIWPYLHPNAGDLTWFDVLGVASGLTNFVFIGALLMTGAARPAAPWWKVLLGCGLLNTFWLFMDGAAADLRIGYYLWVSSYFLLSVAYRALAMRR